MNTKSLGSNHLPQDGDGSITKADFANFAKSVFDLIRSEFARLETALKRNSEENLRSRSLEAAVAKAPILEERRRSVEEMLAPFMLDEARKTRLLADDPEMLDAAAFAALLGLSRQALHEKRKRGDVLGLAQAKRNYWFPRYQVDEHGRILPGLSKVLAAFDKDPWPAHRFLTNPHDGLDGATGREALAAGRVDEVLTIIHDQGEGVLE